MVLGAVGWVLRRTRLGYVVVGSSTAGFVDTVMQTAVHPDQPLDLRRSAQMVTCGALINGVYIPSWFHFLNKRFGERVGVKVVMDQLFFAPLAAVTWITAGAIADARESRGPLDTARAVYGRLQERLVPVWAFDCVFWVPWNWTNFRFVPVPFRPYYSYLGNALFVCFVSVFTHGDIGPLEDGKAVVEAHQLTAAAAAAKIAATAAGSIVDSELPPQLGAQRCAPALSWKLSASTGRPQDVALLRHMTWRCAPAFAEGADCGEEPASNQTHAEEHATAAAAAAPLTPSR